MRSGLTGPLPLPGLLTLAQRGALGLPSLWELYLVMGYSRVTHRRDGSGMGCKELISKNGVHFCSQGFCRLQPSLRA